MQLTGKELNKLHDHPKINYNLSEYLRIEDTLRHYRGRYPDVEYVNSNGNQVKRRFNHLNMVKEVNKYMSSLLYNEQCSVIVGEDKSAANEFIKEVLKNNKFNKNFSEYLESAMALGGLAVKPYVDNDKIEFSWCLANTFYPLKYNSNGISEAVIQSISERKEDKTKVYYTLLEFHTWDKDKYIISNELYRSTDKDKVGKQVPLADLYPDLTDYAELDLTQTNFAYLKPFGFNNISPNSPLGLGLCDNAKDTINQINSVFDEFAWEIKQGKRKVLVSDHYLRTTVDETGRRKQILDESTDVFVALFGDMDKMVNQDITKDIRSDSYITAINHFMKTLEMQVGLSVGTFTFDGRGIKTATEVVSENSQTYRTRNSHLTMVSEFIKDLIISTLELARITIGSNGVALYSGEIPTRDEIGVNFDDGVFTDKSAELDFLSKATLSGFMPKVEAIKRLFDIPEEEARKWLEQQISESEMANPLNIADKNEDNLLGGIE